jgi:hypothetical protein
MTQGLEPSVDLNNPFTQRSLGLEESQISRNLGTKRIPVLQCKAQISSLPPPEIWFGLCALKTQSFIIKLGHCNRIDSVNKCYLLKG